MCLIVCRVRHLSDELIKLNNDNGNDNDNEIIFISIETFTHSYVHDKQWKYGKVKKSWTYISDFPNSYINKLRQH